MRYELGLHRFVLGMLVTLLALFIAVLLYLDSHVGAEHFEVVLSLIVLIVVSTTFGFMGMVESITVFYFGLRHSREIIVYLILGVISIASALHLAIAPDESLQRVALVAAPQAFLFGLAELRIARHLERHPRQRRALAVCGMLELVLGVALVWGATLPSARVAELLGAAACMTFMQLLSIFFYREVPNTVNLRAR
ncbi:hypothetical protein [Terriglobus sp. ADX1]|uniref:hypothetical protein n=1 Tax=Terriglobus sp. ADX1 TaxID=2794063 RepID=UPI002FE573CE